MTLARNDFAARGRLAMEHDEDYRREAIEALQAASPMFEPAPAVAHPAIAFTGCRECGAPIGAPCFTSTENVHFARGADFAGGRRV